MIVAELVKQAYEVFNAFDKPVKCTRYDDFEDMEFDIELRSVSRHDLDMNHIGIISWTPLTTLTPEALAYFMPRLIELAVTGAVDRDGDQFFLHFLTTFGPGPENDPRFALFGRAQKEVMAGAFQWISQNQVETLEIEGRLDESYNAANIWRDEAGKND